MQQCGPSSLTLNQPAYFSLIERYGRRGIPLQIIVSLESIELTPKKSKYFGQGWHLEGQMVSTAESALESVLIMVALLERAHRRHRSLQLLQREHHAE